MRFGIPLNGRAGPLPRHVMKTPESKAGYPYSVTPKTCGLPSSVLLLYFRFEEEQMNRAWKLLSILSLVPILTTSGVIAEDVHFGEELMSRGV